MTKLQKYEDVTFIDSVIKYPGGPVVLKNVHFENCIFVVSVDQPPPPTGE
jgi:hypothetical protein